MKQSPDRKPKTFLRIAFLTLCIAVAFISVCATNAIAANLYVNGVNITNTTGWTIWAPSTTATLSLSNDWTMTNGTSIKVTGVFAPSENVYPTVKAVGSIGLNDYIVTTCTIKATQTQQITLYYADSTHSYNYGSIPITVNETPVNLTLVTRSIYTASDVEIHLKIVSMPKDCTLYIDNVRTYTTTTKPTNYNAIVAVGDSITYGIGGPIPYTSTLYSRMPREWGIINKGVSGANTTQMVSWFPGNVTANCPSHVIILGGTNDIASGTPMSTIQNNLYLMYTWSITNGSTPIAALLTPRQTNTTELNELNTWILNNASELGINVIDFNTPLNDGSDHMIAEYSADGLHPNNTGYAIMGNSIPLSYFGPCPSANFTANVTTGTAPLTVAFTSYSTNATGYHYSFGDGSANSTEENPTHTYATAGTYTVILTATNAYGNDTMARTNYIVVSAPPTPTKTPAIPANDPGMLGLINGFVIVAGVFFLMLVLAIIGVAVYVFAGATGYGNGGGARDVGAGAGLLTYVVYGGVVGIIFLGVLVFVLSIIMSI